MGAASGIMPIFKTSVLRRSEAQPTESDGEAMGFRPFLPLFRGLNVMQSNACKNAQSRVSCERILRKEWIPMLCTMLFVD